MILAARLTSAYAVVAVRTWNRASALAILIGAAVMAASAMVSSAVASGCEGHIGPGAAIAGHMPYDPFSANGIAEEHRVSIVNAGAAPCLFGLRFRSAGMRPSLGGVLAYDIAAGGVSLLAGASGASRPIARLRGPLAPGETGALEIVLIIPRGQAAAPDVYRDMPEMELLALDEHGQPSGAAVWTAPLAIAYTVPPVMSVNLRGGETMTTLGFGELETGQQRGVVIEARSNQTYRLDVMSEQRGVLALTPAIPGQTWSVPYAATFAGQPLHLAGGTAGLRAQPATHPEGDASFPLVVTIGDVGRKRAGRYQDVITVEIRAAIP